MKLTLHFKLYFRYDSNSNDDNMREIVLKMTKEHRIAIILKQGSILNAE